MSVKMILDATDDACPHRRRAGGAGKPETAGTLRRRRFLERHVRAGPVGRFLPVRSKPLQPEVNTVFAYPKNLVRHTVGKSRYQLGLQDRALFEDPPAPQEIARRQVEKFNRTWARALTLPFYRRLAADHRLPAVIDRLDELDQWPVLTKDVLREHEGLVWQGMDRSSAYTTSGSTSTPFSFPAGKQDFEPWYAGMWSYRAAAGLAPFDSFGAFHDIHPGRVTNRAGLALNFIRRRAKDLLNNSWMFEPLPKEEAELDRQLARLARTRPEYLVGRTFSLTRLAQHAERTGILREAGYAPRYTILTSEMITDESVQAVARGFGTTVLSEYGSVELGVIAASPPHATWPMRVLWHKAILRTGPEGSVRVTTIAPRAFPLINYQLGDTIDPTLVGPGGTVLELGPVRGRLVDIIDLPDGDGVQHSYEGWSLAEAVLHEPHVRGIQLVQHEDSTTVLVIAPEVDRTDYLRRASESLRATYPELRTGSVGMAFIDSMIPSKRGKQLLMVPEDNIDLSLMETTPLN